MLINHISIFKIFWYLQAIINYRAGIRNKQPLLKAAARRIFAPIWSVRRHPIYQSIEVADEEQQLRLCPEVRQIIEQISVVSRSGWMSQHQGLDAILEEVNKALKALVPPVPTLKHWEIAARNCIKFLMVIIIILFVCIVKINFYIYKIFLLIASKEIIFYNWLCRS